MLVTHPQADVRFVKVLNDLRRKNIAGFADVAESWRDFSTRIYRHQGEVRIAPDGRILLAVTK